jgi:hypothetical protein
MVPRSTKCIDMLPVHANFVTASGGFTGNSALFMVPEATVFMVPGTFFLARRHRRRSDPDSDPR